MNNQLDLQSEIETTAIKGIAATSATPFWTAFKITLGIGLARFLMFVGVVAVLGTVGYLLFK